MATIRMILQAFLVAAMLCTVACKTEVTDNDLKDIKKQYEKINAKQSDLTYKQVDDITSEGGGKLNGYYNGKEVRKIVSQHFTDTCRTFTEYYFDDGMLIYVLEQNYVYNKPEWLTEEKAKEQGDSVWYDDKKTKLEVNQYYFKKNKLMKWVAPGGTDIPANTSEFIDKESELWAKAAVFIKQLKEQEL